MRNDTILCIFTFLSIIYLVNKLHDLRKKARMVINNKKTGIVKYRLYSYLVTAEGTIQQICSGSGNFKFRFIKPYRNNR